MQRESVYVCCPLDFNSSHIFFQSTKLDDLKTLYKVCFGGRGKATLIRKNIRLFNGFGFDKDSDSYEKKKASLTK